MTASTTTTSAYFNLFDYIREVTSAEVASQMAQGVAWRIDTMIQQAARSLFKYVREDLYTKHTDGLAELTTALSEAEFAEHSFGEAGSGVTGPCETIRDLMFFREAAHAQAAELTSLCTDWNGRPYTYETPDLEELFFSPVTMKIKTETKRRAEISNARRAKELALTEEETASRLAKKLARKENNLRDIEQVLQGQSSAVFEMYKLALKHNNEGNAPGEQKQFWSLDINTQRALIEHALSAAQRAQERAEDNTRLSDREFEDIDDSACKVEKDIKLVLKSPRFVTAARVAEAGVKV